MKTNIKETINVMNEYFINKIISKEFELINVNDSSIHIKVEGYEFTFWTYLTSCYTWNVCGNNDFTLTLNELQKESVKTVLEESRFLNMNNERLNKKKVQSLELQKEIEELQDLIDKKNKS